MTLITHLQRRALLARGGQSRNPRSGCARAHSSAAPGAFALMGMSILTCIYAITKINYTYQIPLLIGIRLRDAWATTPVPPV